MVRERRGQPPQPIDVLLVAPPLHLSASTLYGLNLGEALIDAGRRVRLATPGGPLEPSFHERGVPLHLEPRLLKPVLWRLALRRAAGHLGRAPVGIVHALSTACIPASRALGRRLRAPVVASVQRFARAASAPIDWRGVDAVLVIDDALRQDAVNRRKAPRDRVHVVPAGINIDYEPLPPFAHGGAPVVGTVGELDKLEAQEAFLHAARDVLARVPDAQFVIVGEGGDRERLRTLIARLGIQGNVTFTPVMDQRRSLPVMDVFVLPSAEEGPGHVILEAMIAGRPVIATGTGGAYAAVQDEKTGLLVDKREEGSLGQAVLRLLEDRDLARRLGLHGRITAIERFPISRMVDETLAIYARVGGEQAANGG